MDCPSCNGVIQSQFHADVSTSECGRCQQTIPVKDVFVTTKSFIMHREDFLNRTFRFQKLLREVEKELLLLTNNHEASPKSLVSLEQFYASLQELLAGARNSCRMLSNLCPCGEKLSGSGKCPRMKHRNLSN